MFLDIAVFAILLISCLIAFLRGFIREVLTILAVVGGALAALQLGPPLIPTVNGWLGVDPEAEEVQKFFDIIPYTVIGTGLAYAGVFIVVVIVLSLISHVLSKWAKTVGLGPADKILGVLFGVARAILLIALLFLPFYLVSEPKDRDEWGWLQNSTTRAYVEKAAGWMVGMIPQDLSDDLARQAESARESLKTVDLDKMKEQLQKTKPAANETDSAEGVEARENGEQAVPRAPQERLPQDSLPQDSWPEEGYTTPYPESPYDGEAAPDGTR